MPRHKAPNKRIRKRRHAPRHGLSAFTSESRSRVDFDDEGSVRRTKLFAGLLLLPVCWILLETFIILLQADTLTGNYWRSREFIAFGLGSCLWIALFFTWRTRLMMWFYVAGHELTHAFFVLLCRGQVSKVHISSEGGHILTNRNNFIISLSPYFFPFYTCLVILGWAIAQWVVRDAGKLDPVWLYGLIGFTWMFHMTFTLWMIRRDQPDLDQNGRLFSFTIIFIVNVLLICTMLIVASPTATFAGFGESLWANGQSFTARLVESGREIYEWLPF
ncbi:MAG: hypothetical protein AAGA96_13235 [Verrucomicrobiota bacterium]